MPSAAIIYLGLPGLVSLGALVALRLSTSTRMVIVANLIALGIACYGFEIGAAIVQPAWYANMAVRSMPEGIAPARFDRRTPLAVTSDLRRAHGDSIFALPSRPGIVQVVAPAGRGALKGLRPLAGISRTRTVLCGEASPYQEYDSDRFGFNNPDSVWTSPAAIALIGDSFVHGNCVPTDSTIAGVLRARGIRAVSHGISGNGPLSSLAILREYAAVTRSKR